MFGLFSKSFERVFPPKDLFRGTPLVVFILSAVNSLLLCFLLLDFYFAVDLLIHQGFVQVNTKQVEEYTKLLGTPNDAAGETTQRFDQGLRATAWNDRDQFYGGFLVALCRGLPAVQNNNGGLATLVLLGVITGLLRSLLLTRVRRLADHASIDVATRLRRSIHRQVMRLGPSDLEDRNFDHVYKLFTKETDEVREAIFRIISRLGDHILLIFSLLIMCLMIDFVLTIQCSVPLVACWYLIKKEHQRFASERKLATDRSRGELQLLGEGLKKTRLVRGYGMESFEHDQFQSHLDRFRRKLLSAKQGEGWSNWLIRLVITLCLTIVLFLLCSRVLMSAGDASVSFSTALLLAGVFACIYRPLNQLWELPNDCADGGKAADRIYRYISQIPEVGQAVGAKFLQPLNNSVQFESVSYSLSNNRKLLENLDLKIPGGGISALVSIDKLEARTVAYLLPRFIEPQNGRILFDGEDTAWVTLESLRAETIFVGSTDPFFTGTVFENISCGRSEYSLQDVTEASKEVHAHNFILKLPQGYETVLGEHGEQLNAGQSFRLGLARAALRDPAFLIIEEPDTVLDDDTKSLLDDAYSRLSRDRTLLFLPTRLSTLRRADQIVLIHKGKVEAIGTHASLVKSSATYRHWEYIHYNEFRDV